MTIVDNRLLDGCDKYIYESGKEQYKPRRICIACNSRLDNLRLSNKEKSFNRIVVWKEERYIH